MEKKKKKATCYNLPVSFAADWERASTGLFSHTAGIEPQNYSLMMKVEEGAF